MSNLPQDVYVRCLPTRYGYPLWNPEPYDSLADDSQTDGLRVGDVGMVHPDRGFEVFFNIYESPNHQTYDPHGFSPSGSTIELDRDNLIIKRDALRPGFVMSSRNVKQEQGTNNISPDSEYEFSVNSSEGAVLILPHGATFHGLRDKTECRDLARRSTFDWYRFIINDLRREISSGSLYLITGVHKARSWLFASFQDAPPEGGCLFRVQGLRNSSSTVIDYRRVPGFHIDYKHSPPNGYESKFNQSVFIRGFRIALREHIFRALRPADPEPLSLYHLFNAILSWPRTHDPKPSESFHFSASINEALLSKNQAACVAITHDSDWIKLIETEELRLQEGHQVQLLSDRRCFDLGDSVVCFQVEGKGVWLEVLMYHVFLDTLDDDDALQEGLMDDLSESDYSDARDVQDQLIDNVESVDEEQALNDGQNGSETYTTQGVPRESGGGQPSTATEHPEIAWQPPQAAGLPSTPLSQAIEPQKCQVGSENPATDQQSPQDAATTDTFSSQTTITQELQTEAEHCATDQRPSQLAGASLGTVTSPSQMDAVHSATDHSPSQEAEGSPAVLNIEDLEDTVIAVMGPTGSGKSTFIRVASGLDTRGVGHSLRSFTSEVQTVQFWHQKSGRHVVLVDTPGFDDTTKSDLDILEMISDWLNSSYKRGKLLSGILYLHRITDNRMAGTPLKNLRVFRKLCGRDALDKVWLTTTMWDEVDPGMGEKRLDELKQEYWKVMINQGAQVVRCRSDDDTPKQVIQEVFDHETRLKPALLQQEMINLKKELKETTAGQELYSQLEKLVERQMALLRRISAERKAVSDASVLAELQAEYNDLRAQIDDKLYQMQELKLPRLKKFFRFIARRR